jgi:hypothetical protein
MRFKEYFIGFLKKFDTTERSITTRDVEEFKKGLETLRESSSAE